MFSVNFDVLRLPMQKAQSIFVSFFFSSSSPPQAAPRRFLEGTKANIFEYPILPVIWCDGELMILLKDYEKIFPNPN